MRAIWNLPLVTSLTLSAENDSGKGKGSPRPDIKVPKQGTAPAPKQPHRGGGHGAPDVKRVHSFANRRRNK